MEVLSSSQSGPHPLPAWNFHRPLFSLFSCFPVLHPFRGSATHPTHRILHHTCFLIPAGALSRSQSDHLSTRLPTENDVELNWQVDGYILRASYLTPSPMSVGCTSVCVRARVWARCNRSKGRRKSVFANHGLQSSQILFAWETRLLPTKHPLHNLNSYPLLHGFETDLCAFFLHSWRFE
jgi:hypothetical protein